MPVSPFERAVAGLVLGGEEFVGRVRAMLRGRSDPGHAPALGQIRRLGRAEPEAVEKAVDRVFAGVPSRRRKRLYLYAQRLHSRLRPSEIARRYGRTPGAVSLAARDLGAEARRDRSLGAGLEELAGTLETKI